MIKAIFLDIDGTLVSFKTHTIPESTIEALHKAKNRGTRIFIATGRPKAIINNLGALGDDLIDGFITMNGAYCFTQDKILYKNNIPHPDVEKIAEEAEQRGFATIFVGEHDMVVSQMNDLVNEVFQKQLNVSPFPEVSLNEAIDKEIYQITPFITEEEEFEILSQLSNIEPGRWHPDFVDITAKGNTKQKGIDVIIDHFNINLNDTLAIGDGGNDIGMIQHAKVGVAMGNARKKVQEIADYVTTSVDENGVWNALKKFEVI
ncbi:MAG: Cof-type HAD-IIB family hydrolase [Bacteroidales bacterium]|nr:Cof-type HAD-IIB family hydrolase [Bacteroidales bacterium]